MKNVAYVKQPIGGGKPVSLSSLLAWHRVKLSDNMLRGKVSIIVARAHQKL